MTTFFYDHLIEPQRIAEHVERLNMTNDERDHFITIVRSTIHHDIMDEVLSRLPHEHKDPFLDHVALDKHDEALQLLSQHIADLEELVHQIADVHLVQLRQDVESLVSATADSDGIL